MSTGSDKFSDFGQMRICHFRGFSGQLHKFYAAKRTFSWTSVRGFYAQHCRSGTSLAGASTAGWRGTNSHGISTNSESSTVDSRAKPSVVGASGWSTDGNRQCTDSRSGYKCYTRGHNTALTGQSSVARRGSASSESTSGVN